MEYELRQQPRKGVGAGFVGRPVPRPRTTAHVTAPPSRGEPTMTSTTIDAPNVIYTPTSATILEPVRPGERIAGLDVLRGWAMFGVLLSNLNDWYFPRDPRTSLDTALSFAQDWFVEGRFYSLLVLLFGVGFAIQLTRARERGLDLRNVYLRRSAALLGIGLMHALLIWHGDVLTQYALAAFTLLLFRDATPRQMLAWGILLSCAGTYIAGHLHFALGQTYTVSFAFARGRPWTYAHGTLAQIQAQRFQDLWNWWGHFGLNVYFGTVGAFLLGAWAYATGLVQRIITNRRTTWTFLAVCLVVLLFSTSLDVFNWGDAIWPPIQRVPTSLLHWSSWNPRRVVFALLDQSERAGALVYAALLLLVFQTRRGRAILSPMAALGRMGLTTYLTQSLICTTLFYSYGLGWFGSVTFAGMAAITLTIYAVQLVISTWWLKRFRFGPAEWLWRTVTYGHAPAMRA